MNVDHLKIDIIRPVLKKMGRWSKAAEELLLLTCAQESHGAEYLHQINGLALGIYQMEPRTHDDNWENYLAYHYDGLAEKIWDMAFPGTIGFMNRLRDACDKIETLPASQLQTDISEAVSGVTFDMQQLTRWPDPSIMKWNLHYATAMARCSYLRHSESLPEADDIEGLAKYYKKYYNTPKGAATVEQAISNYERFMK